MARKRTGRPRGGSGRERHTYIPLLEAPVLDGLKRQAQEIHSPLATYMERVIALAHGFDSPFLPDPQLLPLPIAAEPEDLQRQTERISEDDCIDLWPGVDRATASFHLDRALADRINARCDELDVAYAAYLRAVLRPAAGFTTDSIRRLHVQEVLELDGTGRSQKAS